jgi:hypothetical protein
MSFSEISSREKFHVAELQLDKRAMLVRGECEQRTGYDRGGTRRLSSSRRQSMCILHSYRYAQKGDLGMGGTWGGVIDRIQC